MIIDLQNLPSETAALHDIIAILDAEKKEHLNQNIVLTEKTNFLETKDKAQTAEILKLTEQLRLLRNKLYGKSSEKLNKKKSQELQEEIENLELKIENVSLNSDLEKENDSLSKGKARRKNYLKRKRMGTNHIAISGTV